MKVEFDSVLEDWREDVCMRCLSECDPLYRFCYQTTKTDKHDNCLADFEIGVCRKCCTHIEKNWKSKCDDLSPISNLRKVGGVTNPSDESKDKN